MEVSLPIQPGEKQGTAPLPSSTLSTRQFYQHDYLIVLIRDILHLKDFIVVAIAVVVSAGVLFGLNALAGKEGIQYGLEGARLVNLIRVLLQVFLVFPVLAWVSLSLPGQIANIFNSLHDNNVIGGYRSDRSGVMTYENFLQKFVSWADRVWWFIAGIILVVLYWLYQLLVIEPRLRDHSALWLRVAILVISSFMLYAVFYSVVRVLVALVFTNWLFHAFTIKVNPLHPDGSAGLSILDRILTISSVLLVTMGIAALVMNTTFLFGNDNPYSIWQAVLIGTVYLALAPSILIGWLILPHSVLIEARNEALLPLSRQFQNAIQETDPSAQADANSIKAGTDRLAELKRRYQLLQDTYPTDPVGITKIRRLAATITLPALLPILVPILNNLLHYLSKTFGFPLPF